MAEQPTPTTQTPAQPQADQPQPDHVVLTDLVQKLRGAGVVDNQVTREVHLSEADAKQMAETLEQLAQRLEASHSGPRASHARTPEAKA